MSILRKRKVGLFMMACAMSFAFAAQAGKVQVCLGNNDNKCTFTTKKTTVDSSGTYIEGRFKEVKELINEFK